MRFHVRPCFRRVWWASVLLLATAGGLAAAAPAPPSPPSGALFESIDVSVASLEVFVTDASGKPVSRQ